MFTRPTVARPKVSRQQCMHHLLGLSQVSRIFVCCLFCNEPVRRTTASKSASRRGLTERSRYPPTENISGVYQFRLLIPFVPHPHVLGRCFRCKLFTTRIPRQEAWRRTWSERGNSWLTRRYDGTRWSILLLFWLVVFPLVTRGGDFLGIAI